MMELQDLRILLALSRHRSAVAAGRKLKIAHTTVLRAIAAIEEKVGYAIFVRTPDGAVATPEGEELLKAALTVEGAVNAVTRHRAAFDGSLAGTVRLATNLPLAELLLPQLSRLRTAAPALTLELLINQRYVDLRCNDADLAVRHVSPQTRRDDPVVIVRTVAVIELAFFGSVEYVQRRGGVPATRQLVDHDVIEYSGHEWASGAVRAAIASGRATTVMTTDSTHVAVDAVASGLGVCMLPCYVGQLHGLVQVGAPVGRTEVCVLFARDLAHVPRIRVVIDTIAAICAAHEALIGVG